MLYLAALSALVFGVCLVVMTVMSFSDKYMGSKYNGIYFGLSFTAVASLVAFGVFSLIALIP